MAEIKPFGSKKQEWPVPRGTVVLLKSDEDGLVKMTVGDYKDGQLLCRWHDDAKAPCAEWFSADELMLPSDDEYEVDFAPEFSVDPAPESA